MNVRGSAVDMISTVSPSARVCSTGTIASAPVATGAPVIVRIAGARLDPRAGIAPAATVPSTRRRAGLDALAWATSAARTA